MWSSWAAVRPVALRLSPLPGAEPKRFWSTLVGPGQQVGVFIEEDGPLQVTFRIDRVLRVPAALEPVQRESRGETMVGFQTFMTGELFAVTAGHTVLARSVAARAPFDRRSFAAGVEAAQELPLAAALFQVRGRSVLQGLSPAANRSFLSGVCIGAELAGLPAGIPIWVCASAELASA